ncbi:MAG: hypothetical protein IPP13_14665 [Kouleothrix sp.]|nr:hypothetical protein [Kouleothrix sp.]
MSYRVRRVGLALGAVLLLAALTPLGVGAQAAQRCFAETGFCIAGRIREFWEQNGGLPVFGLPIAAQQAEQIEGRAIQAQWFERNRLELHPENARPYDVLLGRLGADRLSQDGRDWFQFPPSQPRPGCQFFAETGHNVCGALLRAWRASGLEFDGRRGASAAESLALFGLPLSDAINEPIEGQEYSVQWFERARFELHPEHAAPYDVLLGRLGSEVQSPLRDLFGQVGGGTVFVFVNPPGRLDVQFAQTDDCRHTGQYGLRLDYDFTGNGNGGWVVQWARAPGDRLDAAQYNTLSFWVRGTAPNGFQAGLKDTGEHEVKAETRDYVAVSPSEWRKVSVPLSAFADARGPVDLAAIRNVNFGFNAGHGAGSVCVDDLRFEQLARTALEDVALSNDQAAGAHIFSWQSPPGALSARLAEGCRHSGEYGLQLTYNFAGAGNGGWGLHWADTPARAFDAATFDALSLWVRGTAPQGFHIGIKDRRQHELKVEARAYVAVDPAEWRLVRVPLSTFADGGGAVDITAIENISLGFSGAHGAGDICIDEIGFQ